MNGGRARRRICKYCGDEVQWLVVLVGAPPGRKAQLVVGVEAHDDGEVIQRGDGAWRMLPPGQLAAPNVRAFRVHSRRSCGARRPSEQPGYAGRPDPRPTGRA